MDSRKTSPKSDIRIGISGWRYEPWRGVFYPPKLIQRRELAFASRALSSIEINGTFYALQKPSSFQQWFSDTPDDFVFSVKAPKLVTHERRLKEVDTPIANFFASGLLALGPKLGPILWQFPPSFKFNPDLFESFLAGLPHDTEAAVEVAKHHAPFMAERARLETDDKRAIRHAVEIRNASFADPAFAKMLKKHHVALVVADTAGKWPYLEDVTADFIYMRLHGDEELYASGYTDAALDRWAERIAAWSKGSQPEDAHLIIDSAPSKRAHRDVYCYFDNDIKVKAPFDAARLLGKLGLPNKLSPEGDRFEVTLEKENKAEAAAA